MMCVLLFLARFDTSIIFWCFNSYAVIFLSNQSSGFIIMCIFLSLFAYQGCIYFVKIKVEQ